MAAANNDNQGLKIAVAALVMLVFILGVTNYFAFSSASQNLARADKATKDAGDSETKARTALEQALSWKGVAGYANVDDNDAAKTAQTKDAAKITQDLQAAATESVNSIAEVQKAGEQDPKLEDIKGVFKGVVDSFVSEPNENKVNAKSLERMKDILINQSKLLRELSLDYRKLRIELGAANSVNSVEGGKLLAARDQAVKEKQDEITRFKTEVQNLYDQITALQNSDKDKTNSITDLNNKLTDESGKFVRYKTDASKTIKDLKDKLALNSESFSGKALGRVTFTDYNRGEVRVSANAADQLKPMMRFTIFDRDAQGVPNDKPKGAIQIIYVGNPSRGERDSVAKIIETKDPLNPIRYNDQIYSPALTPDPERFALVGKIDMNRDGKDDRADLIRLIEQSGGMVEYDLPPPGVDRTPGRLAVERAFAKAGETVPPVTGRGSGRISPRAKAYILDDGRISLSGDVDSIRVNLTPDAVAFATERSNAIKEARANGVTPLPLDRFLLYLGYTPRTSGVDAGNVERKNRTTIRNVLKPQPIKPGAAAPADGTVTPPVADPTAAPATPPTEKAGDPK